MEINDTLIDKLASLSKLHFNEAEKAGIKSDLEKMLQFVDKLNELDTNGVEPLLHISTNVNILRKDLAANMLTRENALLNAPLTDGSFFKVPKVIRK
jgi:aspartyl-tRNA(Asn)/glutamyl-tRNA(Gln) amidotransferase subunit C